MLAKSSSIAGRLFQIFTTRLQRKYFTKKIIYKAAPAGCIFNLKPLCTITPQRQFKIKVRLTLSHNIHVVRSEHFHKKTINNKV